MKTNIFVLGIFLLAFSVVAWDCGTHTLICEKANLSSLSCCLADSSQTPGFASHHCADNAANCSARTKAAQYLAAARPEIAAHLFADALSPPHWFSLDSACHAKFELTVGNAIMGADANWSVVTNCTDKDGVVHTLEANDYYLNMVAQEVASKVNLSATPSAVVPTPAPQDEGWLTTLIDWWNGIVEFLNKLFGGK